MLLLAAARAEAHQAIHGAGIAHHDLKPANVLLAADGPRVIDFGISWVLTDRDRAQSGARFGTPAFMSPEQAAGTPLGAPSDMFSLGLVLTFAAAGPTALGSGPVLSRVPEAVRPVIAPCLAADPDQRPSPAQLLARLGPGDPDTDWRSVLTALSGSVRARAATRRAAGADCGTEFATMPWPGGGAGEPAKDRRSGARS